MQRYFRFSEKQRWDKKWQLIRREAETRFAKGKYPKKIKYIRLREYFSKPSSQYYPKPGISKGR
jgi:hypothetical protein